MDKCTSEQQFHKPYKITFTVFNNIGLPGNKLAMAKHLHHHFLSSMNSYPRLVLLTSTAKTLDGPYGLMRPQLG